MIPYDEVDKTDWVSIEIDWTQEVIDKFKVYAAMENRTLEDWAAKIIYEWFYTQKDQGTLEENYTKFEIPLSSIEDLNNEN